MFACNGRHYENEYLRKKANMKYEQMTIIINKQETRGYVKY